MSLKRLLTSTFIVSIVILTSIGVASAHFTMLFPKGMDVTPQDYIAEIGETKTILIVWGHPFEHILFDMTSTPEVGVRDPEGNIKILTPTEITIEGKKAYKVSFTVDKMGDWVIYAKYKDEDEKLVDYVKIIIHCGEEAWFGWDAEVRQKAEIMPYTRPYGIEEGFVFTGKALFNGEALANADVEIEKYHTKDVADEIVEKAEKMFSYDPPMMFTRVTKTNGNGEFTYTLDEPGIWFIGAYGPEVDGFTQRGIIIVPVLQAFPPEEKATAEKAEVPSAALEELKSKIKSLEDEIATLKTQKKSPGFGVLGAVIGLIVVAYLIKRRKE